MTESRPVDPKRRSVLVVDDEPALLRVYMRSLEADGYAVSSAADGKAAVALVLANEFDAIVSASDGEHANHQ